MTFLVVPLYVVTGIVAVRAGWLRDFSDPITDDQLGAVLTFVASGLASVVTLVGLLLTRSHNERTRLIQEEADIRKVQAEKESAYRLTLDTAVRSLELLSEGPAYAPKAKIAGALSTLIFLKQPAIAVQVLGSAWEDDQIDSDTACWLIGEVVREGRVEIQLQASELLSRRASRLTTDTGYWYWPNQLSYYWPTNLHYIVSLNLIDAILKTIVSRDTDYWGGAPGQPLYLLDEIIANDQSPLVRLKAAHIILNVLQTTGVVQGEMATGPTGGGKFISDIQTRALEYFHSCPDRDRTWPTDEELLQKWRDQVLPAAGDRQRTSQSP